MEQLTLKKTRKAAEQLPFHKGLKGHMEMDKGGRDAGSPRAPPGWHSDPQLGGSSQIRSTAGSPLGTHPGEGSPQSTWL